MPSTDHVLEAIDGALEWEETSDAMRWAPPEGRVPSDSSPAVVRASVRITVIIEQGDRVHVIDIPDPADAAYSMDQEAEDADWYGLSGGYPRMPRWIRTKIALSVDVGESGFTTYDGRQHAAEVLRRFTEDREDGAHVPD